MRVRVVAEEDVRAAVEAGEAEARRRKLNGEMRRKVVMRHLEELFDRSERARVPLLLGTMEAAEVLGVAKTRISRFREYGRMPEPVVELGSGPVFLRSEVEAFAVELREERARREAARA